MPTPNTDKTIVLTLHILLNGLPCPTSSKTLNYSKVFGIMELIAPWSACMQNVYMGYTCKMSTCHYRHNINMSKYIIHCTLGQAFTSATDKTDGIGQPAIYLPYHTV